ncbi:MAG: Spy/CpxP family protein refolding chaperone [Candidatus Rokuibacteriota bacterium]
MKRYAFFTGLGLALGLLGPATVLADQAIPSTDGKPRHHQRFQDTLGLTDDQMTRIREVWQRQREAARPVFQGLRLANRQLRELALNGADDNAIRAKLAEIEGLQGQALQLRVNTLREIAPLLTGEQRQKLSQLPPMGRHRHHHRSAPQG